MQFAEVAWVPNCEVGDATLAVAVIRGIALGMYADETGMVVSKEGELAKIVKGNRVKGYWSGPGWDANLDSIGCVVDVDKSKPSQSEAEQSVEG